METAKFTTFTTTADQTPTAEMPVLIPRPQRSLSPAPPAPGPDLLRAAKIVVGDVPFTVTTFSDAVQWLLTPPRPQNARSVRLANAYCVTAARDDAAYGEVLNAPGINLPDGTPVHWMMSQIAKGSTLAPERVRGPSLFVESLRAPQTATTRHFFLGATPQTLAKLRSQITREFPHVQIAGMYAPQFGPLTPEAIEEWAELVRQSGATILWVGLGSPKQDFATSLLAPRLGVHCIGVGAAFDFLAGTQREAPRWMQGHALEWAYRLITEPRRLWRRYLVGNAKFLRVAASGIGRRQRILPAVYR